MIIVTVGCLKESTLLIFKYKIRHNQMYEC